MGLCTEKPYNFYKHLGYFVIVVLILGFCVISVGELVNLSTVSCRLSAVSFRVVSCWCCFPGKTGQLHNGMGFFFRFNSNCLCVAS